MSVKKSDSSNQKPNVHTTRNGSSYVSPYDILRSTSGRIIIERHAKKYASRSNPSNQNTLDNSKNDSNGSKS